MRGLDPRIHLLANKDGLHAEVGFIRAAISLATAGSALRITSSVTGSRALVIRSPPPTHVVRDLHHPPPTVMISSPEGATTHASRSNRTVVVPCSWTSAGPAIRSPTPSVAR